MPPNEIYYPACFKNQLDKILKKYKNSAESIIGFIKSLAKNPSQGDRIPRFGVVHLRKLRVPLKKYRIGKSGGLRVIYMIGENCNTIFMVAIYFEKRL